MKKLPTIMAANWSDGLLVVDLAGVSRELPNRAVHGLSCDRKGGALAIVDGHFLFQRSSEGEWKQLASCEADLSAIFASADGIYVGTDDARILRLNESGDLKQIENFDSIEGRESWYAGTAIIDGKEVGPPLGVRSMSGGADGLLFANVHVGGIPRSLDRGKTWAATIDVDLDAHEVRVHPDSSRLIVAATAAGLCMSHDSGESWSLHTAGLHAPYCSAVAIAGEAIYVAASESHFSSRGALYRRGIEPGDEPMQKVGSGLPLWLAGIVDTACIAFHSGSLALVSAQGDVYGSCDSGESWLKYQQTLPGTSSVLIAP